jgi:nitroreductase
MEFGQVLDRRRMIRSYDARAVPPEALDAVLSAALRAPSAGFTQGTSLVVLSSATEREAFWRVTGDADSAWLRGMRTAPVLILVWTSEKAYIDRYAEPDKGWSEKDPARWSAPYWYVDAGMASMAALLAAVDQDLGACFFGIPVDRIAAVCETFGVPTGQLSVGVISLGYRARQTGPEAVIGSPARRPRKAPSEVIHRGTW